MSDYEVIITEEYDNDDIHLFKIEIDAQAREIIKFVGNLLDENNIKVFRSEWKSKYNSYMIYDYEPFCTDGFKYIASIEYDEQTENKIAFIKQIISDWIGKVNKLNKILELTK